LLQHFIVFDFWCVSSDTPWAYYTSTSFSILLLFPLTVRIFRHQSPARNGTLNLDEDAVYAYYAATQGWDKATIKAQIIDVYNATDVSNYSALDLTSIMMSVYSFHFRHLRV
jgi:hypothetical protein